ncbi:MAG: GntR family transcriptional regulator [Firmicutes bacterium]|nr:GntR family transcriptional regulator [Bacillota bacterium]
MAESSKRKLMADSGGPQLEPQSPIPLYYQLKEALISRLSRERYKVGDRIPTEAELVKEYQVSRTTVRQALNELVHDGIITRHRGRGSILVKPPVQDRPSHLVGLTEEMKARGRKVRSDVLECKWIGPSLSVRQALDVHHSDQVLLIVRVRYIDGEPVFYTKEYLPAWIGLTPDDDFTGSLFELIKTRGGVHIAKGDMTVTAVAAQFPETEYLDVPEAFPLLRNLRSFYTMEDQPCGYVDQVCRSDRYHYFVQFSAK